MSLSAPDIVDRAPSPPERIVYRSSGSHTCHHLPARGAVVPGTWMGNHLIPHDLVFVGLLEFLTLLFLLLSI